MDYEARVRQTQIRLGIILFAFGNGVTVLTIIALLVGPVLDAAAIADKGNTLRWLSVFLAFPSIPLGGQAYFRQSKRMAASTGWEARIQPYKSRAIAVAAMFEAPALFSAATILLAGFSWHVVFGPALFLIVLAAMVPTRARIIRAIGNADGTMPAKYV